MLFAFESFFMGFLGKYKIDEFPTFNMKADLCINILIFQLEFRSFSAIIATTTFPSY